MVREEVDDGLVASYKLPLRELLKSSIADMYISTIAVWRIGVGAHIVNISRTGSDYFSLYECLVATTNITPCNTVFIINETGKYSIWLFMKYWVVILKGWTMK